MAFPVRRIGDSVGVVGVEGSMNQAAEGALMDAYNELAGTGAKTVILNFDRLDYMNSSGIGLLVTLLIRANRQGLQLLAVGLSDHYKEIFNLTRLDEAIRIFPSESEAAAAVAA
jgi:anti-sigma B factor antagonist